MFKGKKNKINPINNCTVNLNARVNLLKRKVGKKKTTHIYLVETCQELFFVINCTPIIIFWLVNGPDNIFM